MASPTAGVAAVGHVCGRGPAKARQAWDQAVRPVPEQREDRRPGSRPCPCSIRRGGPAQHPGNAGLDGVRDARPRTGSRSTWSPGTGRATPLLWKTVPSAELKGRMSQIEKGLLTVLQAVLPDSAKHVIVLADRGFGDVDLYDHIRQLGPGLRDPHPRRHHGHRTRQPLRTRVAMGPGGWKDSPHSECSGHRATASDRGIRCRPASQDEGQLVARYVAAGRPKANRRPVRPKVHLRGELPRREGSAIWPRQPPGPDRHCGPPRPPVFDPRPGPPRCSPCSVPRARSWGSIARCAPTPSSAAHTRCSARVVSTCANSSRPMTIPLVSSGRSIVFSVDNLSSACR